MAETYEDTHIPHNVEGCMKLRIEVELSGPLIDDCLAKPHIYICVSLLIWFTSSSQMVVEAKNADFHTNVAGTHQGTIQCLQQNSSRIIER